MLPVKVVSESQRIDNLVRTLDNTVNSVELVVQNVYANHIVLAASGYVENSTIMILSEYGRRNGNPQIARYIDKTVSRNNSLNCEKIEIVLNFFNPEWWSNLDTRASPESKSAVDSLKALRDQIAHGRPNGTGYTTVRNYYNNCKAFVTDMGDIVLS